MWVIFHNYNANDIMKSVFEDADPPLVHELQLEKCSGPLVYDIAGRTSASRMFNCKVSGHRYQDKAVVFLGYLRSNA